MFGSDVLEVAIGTIFVILIASLLASSIREMIESLLKARAVQLEKGLRTLLDDPTGKTALKELFDHPMLLGLFEGSYDPDSQLTPTMKHVVGQVASSEVGARTLKWGTKLPSYIPSRNFALALLDVVSGGSKDGVTLDLNAVKANAMTLPDGNVRQAVLIAVSEAENDIERARASLEAWFDSSMDRVSGWYKRKTQIVLLAIGLILAIALNIDSINVVRALSTSTASRQQVIARVDAAYATLNSARGNLPPEQIKDELNGLAGVIGWNSLHAKAEAAKADHLRMLEGQAPAALNDKQKQQWALERIPLKVADFGGYFWSHFPLILVGWILTAIAVSLGAPFWFDLLNKFMVVRATVKPYEKSGSEGSEDRKGGASAAQQLAVQPAPVPGLQDPPPGSGSLDQRSQAPVAATIRLAISQSTIKPGTLELKKNGKPVTVPPDGFVELPLEPDEYHELEATARGTNGRKVSWTETRYATLEDEAEPIEAQLA